MEFFSYPVIAGFTTAAALNIGSAQIKNLLGIKGKSSEFLGAWIKVFENITDTSKWDLILGICSIIFLVFAKVVHFIFISISCHQRSKTNSKSESCSPGNSKIWITGTKARVVSKKKRYWTMHLHVFIS